MKRLLRLPLQVPEQAAAFQVSPDAVQGNQGRSRGGLGLDFDVARPIRVTSLGAFDSQGDGLDAESTLTVQLWLRDNRGTPLDPVDDTAGSLLAELTFSAAAPGTLAFGHRFKPLTEPIDLAPGSYTVVAYGFSMRNPCINLNLATSATFAGRDVARRDPRGGLAFQKWEQAGRVSFHRGAENGVLRGRVVWISVAVRRELF